VVKVTKLLFSSFFLSVLFDATFGKIGQAVQDLLPKKSQKFV